MASKFLQRLTLAAAVVGGLGLLDALPAAARPVRRTARPAATRGFNLFAGAVNVMMNVNRVQCNINSQGETCVDPTNSSTVGGGYWPKGTPDQYIFNSGLMLAAVLQGARATFPWAGDTVGAYIFDPRGTQVQGEGVTPVFNSLATADMAEWPQGAYVRDTTLFHPSLVYTVYGGTATEDRKAVSQQDTWTRYWDGNAQLLSGRQHPMGVLIDQRGLMWNFPSGNADIVYFLYRFINITTTDRAKYANLAAYGYNSVAIDEIVAQAVEFQRQSEAKFNVPLPDSGWTFTQMMAGFGQDPDVSANSGQNYSSAILPFAMGVAYKSNFYEPTWAYPADIFGAPFAAAPGFEGVKYLKSPTNPATGRPFGITMFTNTTNSTVFPDRRGVQELWRLLSGNLTATDGTCTVDPRPVSQGGRGMCALIQVQDDTRFIQASGPFTMKAGESAVIVVAYVHAAPVAAYVTASPSFDMKPAIPGSPERLATGADTLRQLDRAAGWVHSASSIVSDQDANADSYLDQREVPVVPRSLLGKAKVAQAVFDARFLLPFSPEGPSFFTVPGDRQATIVWQKSATETRGDPYSAVASDPLNSLYDPNFRKYDVEGYRIWKGRTESTMEQVAAFDYAGTTITDKTGQFWSSDVYGNRCAPELGITTSCPVVFLPNGSGPTHAVDLVGNIIQIPPGGRVQLASGDILIVTADTAVVGGNSGLPALTDSDVPFVYVDRTVLNGFRYFYAVTAFDINSFGSGPSSLESPLITKQVIPRAVSSQVASGGLGTLQMLGDGDFVLDPSTPTPGVNATTGIFSGPFPPTNGIDVGFLAFVPEVVTTGTLLLAIDSVVPGSTLTNTRVTRYWFTSGTTKFSVPVQSAGDYPETVNDATQGFLRLPFVGSLAARYGGDTTYALNASATVSVGGAWGLTMKHRADANAHPTGPHNGPRWWAGAANENTNDPNAIDCYAQMGSYGCTLADLSRNSGAITGVDIFGIRSYQTVGTSSPTRDMEGITSTVMRAADIKWYWGANGAVDSVVDVTHHVRVPFSTKLRASWGILNDSSFVATTQASTIDGNNALLTWSDVFCVDPIGSYLGQCGSGATSAVFQNHARLSPVAFRSGTTGATATMTTNGNGFILYLNGEWFLMRMTALPAANTVWNARFYSGNVTGYAGTYAYRAAVRPPAVPGLKLRIQYSGTTFDAAVTTDSLLDRVHTVPDPYYVTNQLEITASTKVLRFVNLPSQAIIRIYSASGILVNVLTHNDPTGGGEQAWGLRNRNNQYVASGVYFYHVETPDGKTKIGRFTVVNYAQ